MAKQTPKTQENNSSVLDFLSEISDEKRRLDALAILELLQQVTGLKAKMWGSSIVGFGKIHYSYASGHQGETMLVGFSPRKYEFTIYINSGFASFDGLMQKLGKYKTGKICLYIKKLEDIDLPTLRELVQRSVEEVKKSDGCVVVDAALKETA
jgi:Domain of unknown function (DU1801)